MRLLLCRGVCFDALTGAVPHADLRREGTMFSQFVVRLVIQVTHGFHFA